VVAATGTRSGGSPDGAITKPAAKAKQAGESVTEAACRAKRPLAAAGLTAAAVAGGYALGRAGGKHAGRLPRRRKLLGLRIGPKTGLERTADVLEKLAASLGSAAGKATATTDDVRKIREELEQVNRQSPVEVLLDGLTHRRGAHKRET
jgi:hypothetical protein